MLLTQIAKKVTFVSTIVVLKLKIPTLNVITIFNAHQDTLVLATNVKTAME